MAHYTAFSSIPDDTLFFITTTVVDWVDVFTRDEYKRIIVESLDYCRRNKGLNIHGWVLMTNHLHLVVSHEIDSEHLFRVIGDFKKYSSKRILEVIKDNPEESRCKWMLPRFLESGILDRNDISCSVSKHNRGTYIPVSLRDDGGAFKNNIDSEAVPFHLWQRGFHKYAIYNDKHLMQKMNYLHENPVRAGIVAKPHHYIYSSAPNYYYGRGEIEIDFIDFGLTHPSYSSEW